MDYADFTHFAALDIRAGTVTVNCYGEGDITTPFGGYKQSGVGREGGAMGIEEFLEVKTVSGIVEAG